MCAVYVNESYALHEEVVCAVLLVAFFVEGLRYVSKCIPARYPGYFQKINEAPGNIQGNLTVYVSSLYELMRGVVDRLITNEYFGKAEFPGTVKWENNIQWQITAAGNWEQTAANSTWHL